MDASAFNQDLEVLRKWLQRDEAPNEAERAALSRVAVQAVGSVVSIGDSLHKIAMAQEKMASIELERLGWENNARG